jgi:Tol biopolymer transport system component
VLVDTAGTVRPLLAGSQGPFMYPRLSPDGKRFAMQASTPQGGNDIWVYDIATRTPARLTTTGRALHPTWTPDGRSIVYMVPPPRGGLESQPVRGGSAAVRIPGSADAMGPTVAPDGGSVLYQRIGKTWHVWSASTKGDTGAHQVIADSGSSSMPVLSPDGQWLAYVSSRTGQNEIFVRPFPGPGEALQVSDAGGVEPAWSPDGERVYYRNRGAFLAVGLRRPALAITSRRQLFKDTFDGAMPHRNYDVAPDGSGFLMIAGGSSEVVVVLNWLTELRARLARAP